MFEVLKSQWVISFLLASMLAPLADAHGADVPARKSWVAPSGENQVAPLRAPRLLSRHDIFQVIQNDLARRGIAQRGGLQPEDLRIQSSVPVLKEDMGLKVQKIGFDPLRHEVVFELWASREPQYLPFAVTTRRDPRSWGFTPPPEWNLGEADGLARTGSVVTRPAASLVPPKPPVLAKPGVPATLVMLGQNMRITTTVEPLQPGSKGQMILVRDTVTARVMKAEVVDEGLLQTGI